MGILNEQALHETIVRTRADGLRVVMTNGCFDLLHPGHLHCLRKARTLGDRLLVAVNDDTSVRQLKGAGRPRQPLAQRMATLDALPEVDWVVPFGESTPARLIAAVLPDVLVKGGDYQPDEVVGGPLIERNGGRVAIVETLPGWSTSELLTTSPMPRGTACSR
jgi:D-beta-D-heptose 7-phosphate kinase/D-beta-D-heptose 1-phosphate adenosyltransferase